jgi:GDP-L-fucose synthase
VQQSDRIFVAGHAGLVGSALIRRLEAGGYGNLLLRSRRELDLQDQRAVDRFFDTERPDVVFLAAAKVGGIMANATYPGDFIISNLGIGLNVVTAAHRTEVGRLLNLGSSCVYPREAPQPMREEHLLAGPLEPTNEAYAVAKIAVLKLCEAHNRQWGTRFVSVMPTNLYGPGDNFDLETSHVLPALMRKFHDAKTAGASEVVVWGSGRPRREFLHVDDLADACVFLMEQEDPPELVNVGLGRDLSIAELAELIRDVVGFEGRIVFDRTRPDGTLRKLLDVSRMEAAGWQARIPLRDGVEQTYRWFLENLPCGVHA